MKLHPSAVLVATGCLWGTSFLYIKIIVGEIAPLELVTARLFLGAIVVLSVLAYSRRPIRGGVAFWAKMALLGAIANVIPFALIAWAEQHIDSGLTALLLSTMPLFTALFAAAILAEETFTKARVAGLLAGVAGVAVLIGRDIVDVTDDSALGLFAVLGGAMCYGATAVYVRTLLRDDDATTLTGLQLGIGTLIALALTFVFEGVPDYGALSLKGAGALLMLGLLASGVAQWVYFWLVDNVGSVRASMVTYIIPIVALLLGWAVLDERIGLNTIAGFVLIIAGVAAVLRGQAPASERVPVPAAASGGR